LAIICKFGFVDRRVGSGCRRSTQLSLCSSGGGGVSVQHALTPVMWILNEVLDSNIALLSSFLTAVVNASSYKLIGLSFCSFIHFAMVK